MKNKGAFLKILAVVAVAVVAVCLYFMFVADPVNVGEEIASESVSAKIETEQGVDGETQQEFQASETQIETKNTTVEMEFGEGSYSLERLDFYSDYMTQPESFLCYDDYSQAIGYMLIHNISELGVVIENPQFYESDVQGVIDEINQAYLDLQLVLTPYVDLWSQIGVEVVYNTDDSGLVTEAGCILTLANNLGMPTEEIVSRVNTANMFCVVLIEQLYDAELFYDGMEDKEKIYLIYSYLVNKVVYNYDTLEAMEDLENTAFDSESRDFYTALIEKSSVCQGISSAMIQLCRMVDVPLYVQYGYVDGMAHSWCKYQLDDGSWVYMDPTWAICDMETTSYHPAYWCWVTQEFMEENTRTSREFVDYLGFQ